MEEFVKWWKIACFAEQRTDGEEEWMGKIFVQYDEKTLYFNGNPLAFCALLLYNNANLL